MASLEDEEQIRRLTAAYGDNELVVRALTEGLRELNSATGKQTDDEKRREAAAKKSINALGALADSFITYNKEIYKGKSAAEATASSMDKLGDAAVAAAAGLAILMPASLPIKALIAGLGLLASTIAKGSKEISLQTDTIYKSFQELAKAGATGAGGMQSVFDGLMKVGIGTEKFADYIKLITSNTDSLVLFSGTVDKGKRTFEDTMASMSDQQRIQMQNMVGDRTAQAEATMGYLKTQRLLTLGTKEQMNTSSAAVMRYIEETDKLTRITGINRVEQEKIAERAMRNEAANAAIQKIRREKGNDAADQAVNALKIAAMVSDDTFEQVADSISGFVGATDKSKSLFMATGGKSQELLQKFRDGEITQTQDTVAVMKEMFKALGKSTEMYEDQASMMNYEAGGMGKFYANQRAGFIAASKTALDLADANSELNKALADPLTAKMAKAENDARTTQILYQKELNIGMGALITTMEIEAAAARKVAEAAYAAAEALNLIGGKTVKTTEDQKAMAATAAGVGGTVVEGAIVGGAGGEGDAAAIMAAAGGGGTTPAAPSGRPASGGTAPTAPSGKPAAGGTAPAQGALVTPGGSSVVPPPPGAALPRPENAPTLDAIRDMIGKAESRGGNYNIFSGGDVANLTDMTISEVLDLQKKRQSERKPQAAGKYQVMYETLKSSVGQMGLKYDQRFDKATQDKIADHLIMQVAQPYFKNPTSEGKARLLTALSNIWRGLPNAPGMPKGAPTDTVGNKATISWDDAIKMFGDGGVVNRPTLATIGEKGPEAVIPLKGGAVPVRLDNVGPTFAGYNEYKGYNMGPMSTDLKALEQIAGKLGAYDAATKTITDPKVWKEILNSGMLMNYNLAGVETGTKMLGPDVGNIIGDRINEVIKNNQTDTGSAIAAVRQEFSDAMTKLIDYMKAQNPDSGLQEEMLTTLKEISRTNASAASASEKMLLYAQN